MNRVLLNSFIFLDFWEGQSLCSRTVWSSIGVKDSDIIIGYDWSVTVCPQRRAWMSSHDGVCEPSANSQRLSFQGRTANTYTTQGMRIGISIKDQDISRCIKWFWSRLGWFCSSQAVFFKLKLCRVWWSYTDTSYKSVFFVWSQFCLETLWSVKLLLAFLVFLSFVEKIEWPCKVSLHINI